MLAISDGRPPLLDVGRGSGKPIAVFEPNRAAIAAVLSVGTAEELLHCNWRLRRDGRGLPYGSRLVTLRLGAEGRDGDSKGNFSNAES
jgi:hypothetical protein